MNVPNKTTPASPPEDFSFIVMPQGNGKPDYKPPKTPEVSEPKLRPSSKKWVKYLIAGIVAIIALGAVGYFILNSNEPGNKQTETASSKLPKTWLTKYFNVEICDNKDVCGDEADFDKDGLTNYEEFKHGTDLVKIDTDNDGLADGDELNIYKTDPTDTFTDKRTVARELNYTDGHQIKNGYDPLTPGLKLTETRIQQIADDTAKYGLHAVSD